MARGAEVGYRRAVASRVLAASVGGYALTSLVTAVLALLLPRLGGDTTPAQGVLIATLWSFLLYAVFVLWVFCVRSATRAWVGTLGGCAVAGVMLLWLMPKGGA